MQRALAAAAAAATMWCAAAGCRGGAQEEEKGGGGTAVKPAGTRRVDPATAGSIEGVVSFSGPAPDNPELPIADPGCARGQAGPAHQDLVLVSNGKLQNAFVYVVDGLDDYAFDPPAQEVVIDQSGCLYHPLVVGVQVGQPLTFTNSDSLLHNVHLLPEANRGANFAMATRGMRTTKRFTAQEVMIRTKCDVHPWMRAFVGVVAHPYFAVTGPDGAFKLPGLPPGTYTVEVWHEKLGRKTAKVTVAQSAAAHADFTFAAAGG